MTVRILLSLLLSLGLGARAWACSCEIWEGGNVSDFSEKFISVWAVPQKAEVKTHLNEWGKEYDVSYELVILEAFGQTESSTITASSSVVDGASCGIQLAVGNPQFLSLSRDHTGAFRMSSCTPELPYSPIKTYLQTGEDSYIPISFRCFDKDGKMSSKEDICAVWKSYHPYGANHSRADWFKYLKMWRNHIPKEPVAQKKP